MEAAGIEPASEDLHSELLHACPAPKVFAPVGQESARIRLELSPSSHSNIRGMMFEPAYICGALYRPSRHGPERTWPSYAAIANVLSAVVVFHLFYEKWFSACNSGFNYLRRAQFAPVKRSFTRKL